MRIAHRVVDVLHGSRFGSGFLVTDRLVLTAKHVVRPGEDAYVRTLSNERQLRVELVWWGSDVDAALLRIIDSTWVPPEGLTPVRWGRLITMKYSVPCEAIGFPWSQEQPDGRRDTEHLRGEINLGTGLLDGRYQISVSSGAPDTPAAGLAWAGMSGAAVVSGEHVVGLIADETPRFARDRLTAEPVTRLLPDEGFRELWSEETGMPPVAESVELADLGTPHRRPSRKSSPASLLRAEAEVVRFRGRSGELETLLGWCEGVGPGMQLLTGPGGRGKTRLARELASRLRAQGWETIWLRQRAIDSYELLRDNEEPVLVVIDYAETRTEQLRNVVLAAVAHSGPALRILALARSEGEWWQQLKDDLAPDAGMFLDEVRVSRLSALEETVEGRHDAFQEALSDLRDALPSKHRPAKSLPPPSDLSHPRYKSPLALQIAALATLLQVTQPVDLPPSSPYEEVLLEHERRYWMTAASPYGVTVHRETLDLAIAAATLFGAASRKEALALLTSVPGLSDQPHDMRLRAASWWRDLYPSVDDQQWGGLEPDLLGEHHIARVLRRDSGVLGSLFTSASAEQAQHALTVLSRTSVHQDDVGEFLPPLLLEFHHLAPLAIPIVAQSEDPAALVQALTEFIRSPAPPTDALMAVATAIPDHTQRLAEQAVEVWIDLARALDEVEEKPPSHMEALATARNNLANRLAAIGLYEDAAVVAGRALEELNALSDALPGRARDLRAHVLHNLAAHLNEAGQPRDALRAHAEAIEEYRAMAQHDASAHLPDLAMALNSYAISLAQLNCGDEALAACQEAVAIHRTVEASDPGTHLDGLAQALNTLGARLSENGLHNHAVAVGEEAVTVARRLSEHDRDAHVYLLATTLNSYSAHLRRAGRDSLGAAAEAVRLYRTLAKTNPRGNLPRVAGALANLAGHLGSVGRHHEALQSLQEAIEIYEHLPDDIRKGFLPREAQTLSNLGNRLAALHRPEKAAEACGRAVELMIALAADSAVHLAGLARCRANYAARLATLGQFHDAVREATDAVQIYRELADLRPGRYEREFSGMLATLGSVQVMTEDYHAAARTLAEAILRAPDDGPDQHIDLAINALRRAHAHAPAETRTGWQAVTGMSFPEWLRDERP